MTTSKKTDPHWVWENYGEAALLIDEQDAIIERLRSVLVGCHSYAIETGAKIGIIEEIAKAIWESDPERN